MKRTKRFIALILMLAALAASGAEPLQWEKLPSLPDREGFAAMFTGWSPGQGEYLLAAGGANFPDKKPWEGGKKVWSDRVFVLREPDGEWKLAGKLPRPLAYGVSASWGGSVYCVGGSDADRHYADAFTMGWGKGLVHINPLPSLPRPVANACGAIVGRTLYIAGGTAKPDSTNTLNTFFALEFLDGGPRAWRELPSWPGPPRMLAVAAVQDGSFFLCSGADLSPGSDGKPARTYLKDAYRYTPGKGWKRIADLPRAAVAAPSPAPTFGSTQFLILGGDDGSQVATAPTEHNGFPKKILAYDTARDIWKLAGETPAPRVTVPTATWRGLWLIVSGEQRPGVRSPEVWLFPAR